MDNRAEVREFLMSRRAKVTPQEVGLHAAGARRVPGLRRSEVAELAGVSVEYYAKLERGAIAGASAAVLDALIAAQRAPRPDYAAARALAPVAHALIDASDGPAGDLGRISRASGTAIALDGAALIALARPLVPAAAALGDPDPAARALHWVLTGGEDHGFLAAVPPESVPVGLTRIGTCRSGDSGLTLDGEPVTDPAFTHFTGDR